MVKSKNTKKKTQSTEEAEKSVIARSEDGTIQITFTIPFPNIKKVRDEAVTELGKDIEVPGFRKGMAPADKVKSRIPENTLVEKTLSKLLPKLFSNALNQHKIQPAMYPKFEVLKAAEGEAWQVRAVTCEMPKVNLNDYKNKIIGATRSKKIWTPDKTKDAEKKQPTKEEKEQEIIKAILENIKVKIPNVLVEQEVNARLSRLLERIEKLGLTLDSYLASINKDANTLRKEYKQQAKQSISIELTLTKIAETEGVKVEKSQIDAAINASSTDPTMAKKLDTPEQRRIIASVLKRRAALDYLITQL